MYIIAKQNGHVSYGIKKYIVDTEDDIIDLPLECKMGSSAYVIESGSKYILNSQYEWIKQTKSSSSSSEEIEALKKENQELNSKIANLEQQVKELQETTITTDMWNAITGEVSDDTLSISPQMYTLTDDGTLVLGGETE